MLFLLPWMISVGVVDVGCGFWGCSERTREGSWGRVVVNSDVVGLVWSWRWVLSDDWGKGRTFVMCGGDGPLFSLCTGYITERELQKASLLCWNSDEELFREFCTLSLRSFHFYDGVQYVLWRNCTFVWFALFPQQSSHPCVLNGCVLCSCSVVIHHQVKQHWFVSCSKSTGCNEPSGLCVASDPLTQLRLWTSKTAALHMLEDVIQRCRWWVITSRTWECLYRTGLVALGGRWREWLRMKMEENEKGCMVTIRWSG